LRFGARQIGPESLLLSLLGTQLNVRFSFNDSDLSFHDSAGSAGCPAFGVAIAQARSGPSRGMTACVVRW